MSVETTMIYTHVAQLGRSCVASPLDRLALPRAARQEA